MNDPTKKWLYAKPGNGHEIEQHERERVTNGFSWFDWINFNEYLCFVIVNGLTKLKTDMHSYPSDLSGPDEWADTLDVIIKGFEGIYEVQVGPPDDLPSDELMAWYNSKRAQFEKSGALFVKYFESFWD